METIAFDNTKATIPAGLVSPVYKILSYEVEGTKFDNKKKGGQFKNSTYSFLSLHNWSFPAGLVWYVRDELRDLGIDVEIIDERDPSCKIGIPFEKEIAECLNEITLRDYQVSAVRRIFVKTRGIIQAPTGSGKSSIASAAIKIASQQLGLRCLVLTHKKELLHQLANDLARRAGLDVAIIGDGFKDFSKRTAVGTVQTIFAELKKKDPKLTAWLRGVEMLIVDEAHHADAKSFYTIVNECRSAYYRVGLTATPLMRGKEKDLRLIAATGPVIKKIKIDNLTERGLLARPLVKFVKVYEPIIPKRQKVDGKSVKTPWAEVYEEGIVKNPVRNAKIAMEALHLVKNGDLVLILVTHLLHGSLLENGLAPYLGDKVCYIHGKHETALRQKAFRDLQDGTINVLIASTILDEGVDIPAVSAVILAGGGKSSIKTYQRIGRGMRPKEDGGAVTIIDFIDFTHPFLTRHSMSRFVTIRDESGFEITSAA